ncbi:LacI family DNA-binding transcriptional regulator [Pseudonocardia sp. CA-107938]|uniref:LacI family DNA-binding transcriptional regulator n=1 Tax=Pseudonocardia sp. CA-107938 TaxID=3240021 RepID=UPI003D907412
MYVSLKDVAARAGVSFQTASKVLNGNTAAASAATAERVLRVAAELGYVPNALARGLVRRSSVTIGVLVDDLADAALVRFVDGAQAALAAQGHAVLLTAVTPGEPAADALRKLLEHRVDGVLVVAPGIERDEGVARVLRPGLPLVGLNRMPGADAVLLGSDHRETGRLAAEHLLELGHREIATVVGPRGRHVVRRRLEGFGTALAAAGVALPEHRIVESGWSAATAYAAAAALLDRAGEPITAVFAQNDEMASGVLRLLADRGVRVPEEVSVVGCDDLPASRFLVPALTTIAVPFTETGERAAAVLLDLIAGKPAPRRELLPVRLVVRASTGPPPASDLPTIDPREQP